MGAARPCSYVGPGQLAALPCNCWLTAWTAETSEQRQMVVPLTSLSGRDSARRLIEFKCWDSKPACCLHTIFQQRKEGIFTRPFVSPILSLFPSFSLIFSLYGFCALYCCHILLSTISALSPLPYNHFFPFYWSNDAHPAFSHLVSLQNWSRVGIVYWIMQLHVYMTCLQLHVLFRVLVDC